MYSGTHGPTSDAPFSDAPFNEFVTPPQHRVRLGAIDRPDPSGRCTVTRQSPGGCPVDAERPRDRQRAPGHGASRHRDEGCVRESGGWWLCRADAPIGPAGKRVAAGGEPVCGAASERGVVREKHRVARPRYDRDRWHRHGSEGVGTRDPRGMGPQVGSGRARRRDTQAGSENAGESTRACTTIERRRGRIAGNSIHAAACRNGASGIEAGRDAHRRDVTRITDTRERGERFDAVSDVERRTSNRA